MMKFKPVMRVKVQVLSEMLWRFLEHASLLLCIAFMVGCPCIGADELTDEKKSYLAVVAVSPPPPRRFRNVSSTNDKEGTRELEMLAPREGETPPHQIWVAPMITDSKHRKEGHSGEDLEVSFRLAHIAGSPTIKWKEVPSAVPLEVKKSVQVNTVQRELWFKMSGIASGTKVLLLVWPNREGRELWGDEVHVEPVVLTNSFGKNYQLITKNISAQTVFQSFGSSRHVLEPGRVRYYSETLGVKEET